MTPDQHPSDPDAPQADHLFLATGGLVLALDKATGEIQWQTNLPKAGLLIGLLAEGSRLYCSSLGRVFSLDARTGKILWSNELEGAGTGFVSLATKAQSVGDAIIDAQKDILDNSIPPFAG